MPPRVRPPIPLLIATFLLAACSSRTDVIEHQAGVEPDAPAVGEPCESDTSCDDGLTCGEEGESEGLCTVEQCASNGPGEEHGCPDGSFCYVYDGDQGHDCAAICESDDDCQAINPDLVCQDRTATEPFGLKICVRGAETELNAPCEDSSSCDAEHGLTCGGDEGESRYQCVVEGCASAGPGPEHGCFDDAFCYVYDDDEGHYCTSTCASDGDCQAINPALVCRERSATEEFGLSICVPAEETAPEVGGLNAPCTDSSGCDAEAGLTCGTDGESAGQCVVEGCPSVGPGEESGCPADAFCYVYDGDEGHYCTATCETDADCQGRNPGLVCRERSSTEELGLKICVSEE